MEENKLMVGDWVKYTLTDISIRIAGLIKHYLHGYTVYAYTGTYNQLQSFSSDYVEPIPLTEELLLKNGFVQPFKDDSSIYCEAKENVDWFYRINIHYDVQEGFFIDAYITNKKHLHSEKDFSGLIKYVHELQHILFVSGIEKEIDV